MSENTVARKRAGFGDAITTTITRPRTRLAAVIIAAVCVAGLLVGVAASSMIGHAGGAPALSAADRQMATQARLAWLESEHDSYGIDSQVAAQAHLAWLQSEHDTYGTSTTSLQDWTVYRQFRLSEEGYGQ
jgi:hypothetical protein